MSAATQSAADVPPRLAQQFPIAGTFGKHAVIGDDLVLSLLHLDQLAEFGGLAPFPRNGFRVRLEQADDYPGELAVLWKIRARARFTT